MGYSFINSIFQYHLNCAVKNSETGEIIKEFKAREVTDKELSGGYVPGGIASFGNNYSIATADNIFDLLKPNKTSIVIEGDTYILASKRTLKHLSFGSYGKQSTFKEYVLIMEWKLC